ncbi:MAG TPA: ferredoxin [Bacillota bacterium]|jgi:ferredoxin|nr:ferredoxin [Bacillota bacterium]HOB87537.1 ferredoxin [Bacillota bacterium]HOP68652.1 ferredoxin [Bacillota bacterium]HPT34225.1 ferredoxin [Bacillota bacterium]HQD07014.1 ferredoxin [Bacillota bacterium]
MKALVNDECIYCGLCAELCPEVFQLADDKAVVIVSQVPEEQEDCCREAAEECPTDAIELSD